MNRRTLPLIAIVCALLLLGAQQFAFAHYISHVGAAASSVPVQGDGDGDSPADSCATCVTLAALSAASPAFLAPIDAVPAAPIPFSDITLPQVQAGCALAYGARAPPAFL